MTSARVDFYFDPVCPWTWNTSRWLDEVARARGLTVHWRPLSLLFLNADREVPEQFRAPMEAGLAALRVVAAARAGGQEELIGDFYTELGRRLFYDQAPPSPAFAAAAAEAAGLGQFAATADDASYDDAVRASTREAIEQGGPDVGSPVLVVDGTRGFHGPIVSPPPIGDDAVRLWDAVATLARLPGVYEIKHGREGGPELGPRP